MIELDRVGLRYRDGTDALRDVSFHLERGSLHFLTGPSGAGKSSLLRLLYLALRPTSGRLRVFDREAEALNSDDVAFLRRRIGVVLQDFQLLPHLNVFENVALPLVVADRPEREYRDNVTEMLEWVMLADKMYARPDALSGGEKQRAAIARAMVSVPDVILADEPTGSVDPDMAERIMTLFIKMQELGKTVLFATHDMTLVKRFHAPTLILRGGRLASAA